MRHHRLAPLALMSCSIIVALLLAELGLRLYLGARQEPPLVPPSIGRYDAELGWSLWPGARAVSHWQGREVEYAINSHGFRGAEVAFAKPPGVFRIVVVGDSNTFAVGVPVEQSFAYILEGYFDAVEVINLGVSGYGIDQELLVLQSVGFRYEPDLVIAYVPHFNDHRHMHARRFGKAKPYFELAERRLVLVDSAVPSASSCASATWRAVA